MATGTSRISQGSRPPCCRRRNNNDQLGASHLRFPSDACTSATCPILPPPTAPAIGTSTSNTKPQRQTAFGAVFGALSSKVPGPPRHAPPSVAPNANHSLPSGLYRRLRILTGSTLPVVSQPKKSSRAWPVPCLSQNPPHRRSGFGAATPHPAPKAYRLTLTQTQILNLTPFDYTRRDRACQQEDHRRCILHLLEPAFWLRSMACLNQGICGTIKPRCI